jgi:hypothetical protein
MINDVGRLTQHINLTKLLAGSTEKGKNVENCDVETMPGLETKP